MPSKSTSPENLIKKPEHAFHKDAIEVLEIKELAITTKECWVTTDNNPPLAFHNWLEVPRGTIVGLTLHDVFKSASTNKVPVYIANGLSFQLVTFYRDCLKPYKEEE